MPSRKYLCLQRRTLDQRQQPPSPEQMRELYAVFNAWREKYKSNIVDIGGRLVPGGKVVTSTRVVDGPFAEAKEVVGGYMVISADSVERALDIARESPGLVMPGSSIEVRELADP